jgi:hypothetical protein
MLPDLTVAQILCTKRCRVIILATCVSVKVLILVCDRSCCLTQMLGDNTSELVTKLVTKMQPGIDSSTAGLSEQATAFVMEVSQP